MKKIISIFSSVAILMSLVVLPASVSASTPNWNLLGPYSIAYTCTSGCSGVYTHTMNISSMNMVTGDFTGTGFYDANSLYTWGVTGTVSGNDITYHVVYTGINLSYTIDATGVITSATSMNGTATGPGQSFTWTGNGTATEIVGPLTTKDQCKKDGWKTREDDLGNKFKNQGDCVSFVATKEKNKGAGGI